MHPLMQIFFKTPVITADEHAEMFNQWERRVIEYIHGKPQPRTIKEMLDELHMNCSTVYRIVERLTHKGVLIMTHIYIENHGKRVKAFTVNKEAVSGDRKHPVKR
jgi:DNA-binding MarR family transcriptional regulator